MPKGDGEQYLEPEHHQALKDLGQGGGGVSVADQGPAQQKSLEERNRLVQLVKLQAKEVDALKAEINMLRRKGGHVYTPNPAAAPKPPTMG